MAEQSSSGRGFERHAFTVTLITIVSRFGGLIREASFSRFIGVSESASALAFAMLVPNLFRRLFGEGALSAAIVPELASLEDEDPAAGRRLATLALTRVSILLVGIVLLGELVLALLPREAGELHLGLRTLMITLPYMPLVCVAALAGAVLQVRGRFGPAASMPIVFNVCLVVGVGIAYLLAGGQIGPDRINIVAFSLLAAGVAQAAWTVLMVRRSQPDLPQAGHDRDRANHKAARAFRRVIGQSLPMILGLGVLQLNTFLDGLIAGWPAVTGMDTIFGHPYPLDADSLATLTYAQRLYEFPLGVFGIAVATAIFPQLSREVGKPDRFRATLRKGLRLAFFIGVPASVGIALLREPIVAVVYQGLAFDVADVARVSPVLLAYSVAIWSYSLNQVFTRAFYARREAMIAVWIAIGVVVLNLALNILLVFGTSLGVAGLAWSTAICAIVQSLALLFGLRLRLGGLFSIEVRRSVLRTLVVAIAMGVVVSLGFAAMPAATSWAGRLLQLLVMVPVGAVSCIGLAALLGMPEVRWAIGRSTTPATPEDADPMDRPPGNT